MADSVNGPWRVADSVPPVIYSIPPTSPLYYVTYVRIYGSTPEYVYEGYTPGYLGTAVAPDNVVVYGTGYYYTPWVGNVWYGEPITWGLGCAPGWTPWFGWSYGFGVGWFWGEPRHHCAWHPPAPWWGPYGHWAHRPWGGVTAWGLGGWVPWWGGFSGPWWRRRNGRVWRPWWRNGRIRRSWRRRHGGIWGRRWS